MIKELLLRRLEIKDPNWLYLYQKEHHVEMIHRCPSMLDKEIDRPLLNVS